MKRVRKAVIPAAGLGTRVLPATKVMPKEMLQIVDKPAIQYIVEEAVRAGIEEILIITSRGKCLLEDHFDRTPELEDRLYQNPAKRDLYDEIVGIANLVNITFIRQKEIKGLGHAVGRARAFVGDEPFAILYGDDVIIGEDPALAQLIRAYEAYGKSVVGVKEVQPEMISQYSSLKLEPLEGTCYRCVDMIEKPEKGKEFSLFSILGRCVLDAKIFDIIEKTPPGAGGEIQLTDAMCGLARAETMTAVDFTGTRYDMGNKLGIMRANVEVALQHPQIGADFRAYLKKLSKTL